MRGVFSVDVPRGPDGLFPSDTQLTKIVQGFGWEPVELRTLRSGKNHEDAGVWTELYARYKQLAGPLFDQMPEVAAAEKNDVIFYGYVADDQTKFVVTRPVENQITFRLLHPVLPRLQASSKKIVRKILAERLFDDWLRIGNNRIVVYEREHDHIIVTGRVIASPWRETLRTNLKDVLLAVVPLLLLIPVLLFLAQPHESNQFSLLLGTTERVSTALITTALVSVLGLATTYYDIRRNRSIAWDVARDSALARDGD